jgi:hypothetical protein
MTGLNAFVLCRSDKGDGGWSLHAPDVSDEAIARGDAPCLLSGTAEWDAEIGEWSRPDREDYADAMVRAVGDELLIGAREYALDNPEIRDANFDEFCSVMWSDDHDLERRGVTREAYTQALNHAWKRMEQD